MTAFLAFPLLVWAVRRLRGGPASRRTRAVLFGVGAVNGLAVATVLGFLAADANARDVWEWTLLGTSAALLGLAVAAVVALTVQGRGPDQRVTVALAGPYAAVFVLFLVGYAMSAQLGWYLALAPTAAAVAELLAAAAFAFRRPAPRNAD